MLPANAVSTNARADLKHGAPGLSNQEAPTHTESGKSHVVVKCVGSFATIGGMALLVLGAAYPDVLGGNEQGEQFVGGIFLLGCGLAAGILPT